MSAIWWNGQNQSVAAPAAMTTAEIRKAGTSPAAPRDDSPDQGSGSLGAEQDHLVDRQSAGAHPPGQ